MQNALKLNQPANDGVTALAKAKQKKHTEIVQFLTAAQPTKYVSS